MENAASSGVFTRIGVPYEIRTRVTAVKGRCPRPLDEGDLGCVSVITTSLIGGGKRDRTADLLHAMQALSQLSYTPNRAGDYIDARPIMQRNYYRELQKG